jgi:hypothetical protein
MQKIDGVIRNLERAIVRTETLSKICSLKKSDTNHAIDCCVHVTITDEKPATGIMDVSRLNSEFLKMTTTKLDRICQIMESKEKRDIEAEYLEELSESFANESDRLARLASKSYDSNDLLNHLKMYARSLVENPGP